MTFGSVDSKIPKTSRPKTHPKKTSSKPSLAGGQGPKLPKVDATKESFSKTNPPKTNSPASSGGGQGKKLLRKNPAFGLFTLGAIAATGWWMRDSYQGSRERDHQEMAMHQANKDYAYTEYDWGRYSGQPNLDNLAHRVKGLMLYGPYGMRERFQEFKLNSTSFFNDVITPNLLPMGVAVASLYGYFGPSAINSKLAYARKTIGNAIFTPAVGKNVSTLAADTYKGTIDKSAKLITAAYNHPGVASGLVLLGAYFLDRFNKVYSGRAQQEFFRGELTEHRAEGGH